MTKKKRKHEPGFFNTNSLNSVCVLAILFLTVSSCRQENIEEIIDLQGRWEFCTDSLGQGVKNKWWDLSFTEVIPLPGSMKDAGKGNIPGLNSQWTGSIYDSSWFFHPGLKEFRTGEEIKFPFWLTPMHHYLGAAWYKKQFDLPVSWEGKRVFFTMERPHWQSSVWVNGQHVSDMNSLSAPHTRDITEYLIPGANRIAVRIDNRIDQVNPGPDSHSVSDHTQGNWNGITGKIQLCVKNTLHIKDVQLYPDIHKKQLRADIVISNSDDFSGNISLKIKAASIPPAKNHATSWLRHSFQPRNGRDTVSLVLPMGEDFNTWDEFNPSVYNFIARLESENFQSEKRSVFGMRQIRVEDKQILVNDRPVFMRGNVDCCVFPLTGYPPMDEASWTKVFKTLKDYGLNHVRFHSWCPPEAAFIAADKLGLYLQPEGPTWPNHGTSLGNGRMIDQYIYQETERIFKAYGNHPSFVMFAAGNEPRGNYVNFLNDYLIWWKAKDSRRIYTGASIGGSWKECQENQYHVKGGARGLPWKRPPQSTFTYTKNISRFEVPFITHELGQYCAFPDFREIENYTGTYRARNFEMFRELLNRNHMGDQAGKFLLASGELQKRCYKYEMEASLRTKGMAGYQLLSLNDFPGQGTALVGVLNAFYESKGYADPEFFRQFCGPVTLTATLPKFTWERGESFHAGIQLANYGAKDINNSTLTWQITNEQGIIISKGEKQKIRVSAGRNDSIAEIRLLLDNILKAEKYTLTARLDNSSNTWNFWVFPTQLPAPGDDIYICNTLDDKSTQILAKGGKVLLLANGKIQNGKDVIQYFTPVFWNTSWFKMRPPHITGLLIDNNHPVFKHFPTDFHSDIQWWELTHNQQVMNLENFPADFRPLIQPIDTWFLNRRLAMLWESETGGGKLMVCSADIRSRPNKRIVARQLLYSILVYMKSDDFNPQTLVDASLIHELMEEKDRTSIHLYTKSSPDELKPDKY